MIDIENLRRYALEEMIVATNHAAKRFSEREINMEDIYNAINSGEIIEQYPDDFPYPSCLILGNDLQGEKIHVVLSDEAIASRVITAYRPNPAKWSEDFKIRRQ